ncbi:MAG: RIO1 family regulatory kinase/ATPase [Alphaproteobacteria bacterium]|nr:RIO1 family regulatory kinase/ATPase [Alphaproteobacteria bacterium]
MDYLQFGYDLLTQNPNKNIVAGTVDGRRVWVKKASPSKKTFWHVLQGVISKLVHQPILTPTVIDGAAQAFIAEIQKMRSFREKGISVPEIHAANDTIMVMSDLGECLEHLLNQNKEPVYQKEILEKAITALANLHKKGLVHGKPYVRDMTLVNNEIGFLDLEENPQHFMSLAQAQARDVWLFLSFVAKYARNPQNKYNYSSALIQDLYNLYKSLAAPDTLAELHKFVVFLKPIGVLLRGKPFWRLIGSDARRAVFSTLAMCKFD